MPPTRAELDAQIAYIAAAPKEGAAVSMLCWRPARGERRFVDALSLTVADGIAGDRWKTEPWLRNPDGTPHRGIQVCILQQRVLDLVWTERETIPHPGDTFIVDMDLCEANLPVGTELYLGTARLRVSDVVNDACAKWKVRYGTPAYDWVRDPANSAARLRGILCEITQDGVIRSGDRLTKQR